MFEELILDISEFFNFSFKLAKDIDGQLKQMVQDLKSIIDHLNTANTQQQDNEDPVRTSITLEMLQWYQRKEQCSEFGICFFLFKVISMQVVLIRPQALRLPENFDQFKYSLHIWDEYSSTFFSKYVKLLTPRLNKLVSKRLIKETTGYPRYGVLCQ